MNCDVMNISFDDIIGYEKEKEELKEIQNFIINTKAYEENGARAPKGVLLIGDSGNGKTLMAKALATDINIPFYQLSDGFDEATSVSNIRSVFEKARRNAPCIIFIDEIDKLEKADPFFNPEEKPVSPVIRELLIQMDGFKTNSGIVVVATANSSRLLNDSLLRSGRFDRIIDINMPSKKERKLLFEYYSKNKKINDLVDFEKLAIRTSGASCADIDNILNDAALMSIRDKQPEITTKYIEEAIDRVLLKSAASFKISEESMKKTAVHEVGHAVVSIALGKGKKLNKISIVSRGPALGFNRMSNDDDNTVYHLVSQKDIDTNIRIAYGGIVAEEMILHEICTGCGSDLKKARFYAKSMVELHGMYGVENSINSEDYESTKMISQKKKRHIEKLIDKIQKEAYRDVKKTISNNMELFNKLYDALLESNVLYKEEIDEIVSSVNLNNKKNIKKKIRRAQQMFGKDIVKVVN